MRLFEVILLVCLVVCAVSVGFTKDLLTSIVIFMSYSLIMCVIWVLLQSPCPGDLGSRRRGRSDQHPVFRHAEKNQGYPEGGAG